MPSKTKPAMKPDDCKFLAENETKEIMRALNCTAFPPYMWRLVDEIVCKCKGIKVTK